MKRISLLFVLVSLFVAPIKPEPWGGKVQALTTSTGIRIVGIRTIVSSFVVQVATGSTNVAYLLYAPSDVAACNKAAAGVTLIAELQGGTAIAPGGNVTVPSNPDPQGGIDLRGYCVQGVTGDSLNIAWNLRN